MDRWLDPVDKAAGLLEEDLAGRGPETHTQANEDSREEEGKKFAKAELRALGMIPEEVLAGVEEEALSESTCVLLDEMIRQLTGLTRRVKEEESRNEAFKSELADCYDRIDGLEMKIHNTEADLCSTELKLRKMHAEKNAQIKQLNYTIKDMEKKARILAGKEKQYQNSIRKLEGFVRKLQDTIDKKRTLRNTSILPEVPSARMTSTFSSSTSIPKGRMSSSQNVDPEDEEESQIRFLNSTIEAYHSQIQDLIAENLKLQKQIDDSDNFDEYLSEINQETSLEPTD